MKTYSCIVKLCDVDDQAPDLYAIYQELLNKYINDTIYPSIQTKAGESREFLIEYAAQWKKYTIFVFCLKKMFDYLDRFYLKHRMEYLSNLTETALSQFKEKIFNNRKGDLRWSIL